MENRSFIDKNISIGRLLVTLMMVLIVVVGGTFAWLTYSSKQTALVLTIGNINDTQIKLSPYEVTGTLSSSNTYTSGVHSDVEVTKGTNNSTSFALFYKVNDLDMSLVKGGLSYTIVNTSTGNTVKTGKFSELIDTSDGATVPDRILILDTNTDTNLSANTATYYKVYLWLDNSVNQSNITDYTLDMELNGSIGSITINKQGESEYSENTYGEVLTTTIDDAIVDANTTYSYQWYRNTTNSSTGGTLISGATESTYRLNGDDIGKYVYVVATVVQGSAKGKTLSDVVSGLVVKRAITVTAGSAEKSYDGTPLTNDTCTVSEGTLVDGHTYGCDMTDDSTITNVGSVDNVISTVFIYEISEALNEFDVANNYEITKVNGTLTVTKIPGTCTISTSSLSITIPTRPTRSISYSCTGDGEINVTSSNTNSITVNSFTDTSASLTGIAPGTSTITVSISEGENYGAGSATIEVPVTGVVYNIYYGNQGEYLTPDGTTTTETAYMTWEYGTELTIPSLTEIGGSIPTNYSNRGWTFAGWDNALQSETTYYNVDVKAGDKVTKLSALSGNKIYMGSIYERTITMYSGISKSSSNTTTQYMSGSYGYTLNEGGCNYYFSPVSFADVTSIANWTTLGYGVSSTANGSVISDGCLLPSSSNLLYARYSRDLNLTYDANGGTLVDGATNTSTQTIYLNTSSTTTSSQSFTVGNGDIFTRPEYTFMGWNTESGGGGTSVESGGTYNPGLSYDADSFSSTLYAQWAKVLTATFYYYDGSVMTSKTSSCNLMGNATVCTVTVPSEVTSSVGPYSTQYMGVAETMNSISSTNNFAISTDKSYYAFYGTNVTEYYSTPEVEMDNRTLYRYSYITNNSEGYNTIISTTQNQIPEIEYVPSDSNNGIPWAGYSTSSDTMDIVHTTVTAAAESTSTALYSVYSEPVTIYYPSSLSAVSSSMFYRNMYFTDNDTINVVLNTTSTATDMMSEITGIYQTLEGFATSLYPNAASLPANPIVYSTISSLAESTETTAYAISSRDVIVTYDANGGSGAPDNTEGKKWYYCATTSTTFRTDATIVLSTTKPTLSGYTFAYWYSPTKETNYNPGTPYVFDSSLTLYAIYNTTLTATFYYYNGSNIVTTTDTCDMLSTQTSCSGIEIPSEVSSSKGIGNTTYRGVATNMSSFEAATVGTLTENTTYYAFYKDDATMYVPNTTTCTSESWYKNSFFTSTTNFTSVLTREVNGTTNGEITELTDYSLDEVCSSSQDICNDSADAGTYASSADTVFRVQYYKAIDDITFHYSTGISTSENDEDLYTSTTRTNLYEYLLCNVDNSDIETSSSVIVPPIDITSSTGPYNTTGIGWTTEPNTMSTVENVTIENTDYYGIYKRDVPLHIPNLNDMSCSNETWYVTSFYMDVIHYVDLIPHAAYVTNLVADINAIEDQDFPILNEYLITGVSNFSDTFEPLSNSCVYDYGRVCFFENDANIYLESELYMIYEKTVTVDYDLNGGTGTTPTSSSGLKYLYCSSDSQAAFEGHSVTIPTDIPTKTGFTFKGWNTAADGSGVNYASGASVKFTDDTTLYAQWDDKENYLSAIVYYYDDSDESIKRIESGCEYTSPATSCDIPIPDVVTSSSGPREENYVGLTMRFNDMYPSEDVDFTGYLEPNTAYYAIYQQQLTMHIPDIENASCLNDTYYRNSFFTSASTMNTVITDYIAGTTNATMYAPDGYVFDDICGSDVTGNCRSSSSNSMNLGIFTNDFDVDTQYEVGYGKNYTFTFHYATTISTSEGTVTYHADTKNYYEYYTCYDDDQFDHNDFTITAPVEQHEFNGQYGVNAYTWSDSLNSMTPVTLSKDITTYYAIYSDSVLLTYPMSEYTAESATYYRNSYFTSPNSVTNVLSSSMTGTETITSIELSDYDFYCLTDNVGETTEYCLWDSFDAFANSHYDDAAVISYTRVGVSYNLNGVDGTAPETVYGNKYFYPSDYTNVATIIPSIQITDEIPTVTNYTFTGWNTETDGSGTSYLSGESYEFEYGDTLYAQWRANQVIIHYSTGGGYFTDTTTINGGVIEWSEVDGIVYGNGSMTQHIFNFDSTTVNLNNVANMKIEKDYYTQTSGAEWTCTSGNCLQDTYDESINYTANVHICDTSEGDCTVTLTVNWRGNVAYVRYYPGDTYTTFNTDTYYTEDNDDGLLVIRNSDGFIGHKWTCNSTDGTSCNPTDSSPYKLWRIGASYNFGLTLEHYTATEGAEWKCSDGDCDPETTYQQYVDLDYSAFCDPKESDCTVVVEPNWRANIAYIRYSPGSGTLDTSTGRYAATVDGYSVIHNSAGEIVQSSRSYTNTATLNLWNVVGTFNITKTGYAAIVGAEWKCASGNCLASTYNQNADLAPSSFCDNTDGDCTIVLEPNWNERPKNVAISTTSTLKSAKQTATLTCTDDVGVVGYYWGTEEPTSSSTFTLITSTTSMSVTKEVNTDGTYYLACKDGQGATSVSTVVSQTYYSYDLYNMVLNVSGTSGTYDTDNYTSVAAYSYIAPAGTSLSISSIVTYPNEASVWSLVQGYYPAVASATAVELVSKDTPPTLNANSVYAIYFDRTSLTVTIKTTTGGTNKVVSQRGTTNTATSSGTNKTISIRYGETITATATASDGYVFTGWTGGFITGKTNPLTSAGVTSNVTITANFEEEATEYSVTVNHYQMNTDGSTYTLKDTETVTQIEGQSLTPSVKTYSYFTAPSTQTVSSATTVNYYYTRNRMYIKYKVAGGTIAESTTYNGTTYTWSVTDGYIYRNGTLYTESVLYGKSKDLSNYNGSYMSITKTGRHADADDEWECTSGNCTRTTYDQSVSYTATDFCDASAGNCTITVQVNWVYNTYTVEYYNGSTKLGSSSHTYNTAKTLTSWSNLGGSVSVSGYSFSGWNKSTTGLAATYTDGQSVKNLTSTNGGTVKLYAVYGRIITFYSGLYKSASDTVTQYYNSNGTTGTITTPTPADITNWTKLGWRDDDNRSVKEYDSAASITPSVTTYNGVYSRAGTLKYNGNSNTGGSVSNQSITSYLNTVNETYSYFTATLKVNGFTRTYYKFSSWGTSKSGGTTYAPGASYGATLSYDGNMIKTVYAIWAVDTSKKCYCSDGHSANCATVYADSTNNGCSGYCLARSGAPSILSSSNCP